MNLGHKQWIWAAPAFCALGWLSCATPQAPITSPVTLPEAFSTSGSSDLPAEWWSVFEDAQLSALVGEALEANFSLREAWDRLDQAYATAAKSGADLWPSLDASAGFSRSVRKETGFGRTYTTSYSLGLAADYEVDLWGKVRSARDASLYDALATREDLHAAAMTLSAQIAYAWYQLVEQHGQIRLLDRQIQTYQEYLDVITLKFRRGQVSATDVLQQRQLIESTKGGRTQVESKIRVLEHQLAVLLGRTAGRLDLEIPEVLLDPPALPKTGVPAEWVRRRPDLGAAELRVAAVDRRVAVAIGEQFPRLNLSLSAGTDAEHLRDLFDNWLASLAANLVAPLVDGGRRRAEVWRTQAAAAAELNRYGQVLLTAIQEVEDALAQEAKQEEYIVSLERQLVLSGQATEQTRENYTKGATEFIRFLTAQLSHQNLQRSYLQARRERMELRIDLYRALGGSWPLSRPGSGAEPESAEEQSDDWSGQDPVQEESSERP